MITQGQIYETNTDIPIICMTSWRAPFTGGHDRILKKGEKFKVSHDPAEKASAVYCDPLRYKELHKKMVPRGDRMRFWVYAGYYFCIKLEIIRNECKLVEE
ncbi:hypothetical protein GCM10007047_23470 [Cerasicoccus arenae]|uniref:Uncharacterized protein n=1 Tax=Cerasicoccus arenae TaxID=424488 RepID=A0A8J3DGW7_9BACT|nr:hypothetical protein GCM10007047_23470 [Cerasicoccus arenae]